MTKWSKETAAERCEFCGRSIWADLDAELYVDANDEFECSAAPMVTNAAGAQYPPMRGIHEPA